MIYPFISALKRELSGGVLPGLESQCKMAPVGRISFPKGGNPATGSVLLLLYPEESIHIVMIRRTDYPGPHSGQISFPGGKTEPADRDPAHTALREAREETGVPERDIEILGQISPLYIPVSNFSIVPVVGFTGTKPRFKPDPREVNYLITPLLSDFLREDSVRTKTILIGNETITAPYYHINNEEVWGATAMIMSEFLEIAGDLV
jgi:8-oxo-dGTP pyrophosphatase MutT (NUDIX family)